MTDLVLLEQKNKAAKRQPRWPGGSAWRVSTLLLTVVTLGVAFLLLLTPAYLILRTSEAGAGLWELLSNSRNWGNWGRTLLLCVSVTSATAMIAVPLAWLVTRTDLPGRRFWAVTAALPLVIPSYVFAYLFIAMFGTRGTLQQWLEPLFGIERLPDINGFWGAAIVLTLITYPYTYLSIRAFLKGIDPAFEEAARSLGMSTRRAFWYVILPQMRPAIVAGSLLVALYTLRDFGAVHLLRYSTFTRAIYVQYQSFFNRSNAAALALQLVLLAAVVLYLERRFRGRARYTRTGNGVARRAPRIPLGRWKWPALAFVGGTVGLSLFMPAFSLSYWLARGLQQDWGLRAVAGRANLVNTWELWEPALNSMSASFAAAVLTVLVGLPVAIMLVRHNTRFSRLMEQLTYFGFALPGIVIALAMVFYGARYVTPIYQTLILLVIAYMILFLPQAVGTLRANLLQVNRHLEEAGRTLGQRPTAVLRRITLPLVSPGILSGGALVFLTCMKELPTTLILSPLGFNTLAEEIWANISEAFFAQAALPTLLLILLSSVPLALLNRRD